MQRASEESHVAVNNLQTPVTRVDFARIEEGSGKRLRPPVRHARVAVFGDGEKGCQLDIARQMLSLSCIKWCLSVGAEGVG